MVSVRALFASLALTALSACASQTAEAPVAKAAETKPPTVEIIGGNAAAAGEFPWQVGITIGNSFCGGTIINAQWVLTAGHCLTPAPKAADITVFAGSLTRGAGTRANVQKYVINPNYNPITMADDVALLKLAAPLALGGNIQSIPIVSDSEDTANVIPGAAVTVSGWGYTSTGRNPALSDNLMYLNEAITTDKVCDTSDAKRIKGRTFCAAATPNGFCSGDSGGPLVITIGAVKKLAGVVNYSMDPCGSKSDIYARIAKYRSWINTTIAKNS